MVGCWNNVDNSFLLQYLIIWSNPDAFCYMFGVRDTKTSKNKIKTFFSFGVPDLSNLSCSYLENVHKNIRFLFLTFICNTRFKSKKNVILLLSALPEVIISKEIF